MSVGNVSFGSNYQQYDDAKRLAYYVSGRELMDPQSGPFTGMGSTLGFGLLMETPKAFQWAKKAHRGEGIIPSFKKSTEKTAELVTDRYEKITSGEGGNLFKEAWSAESAKEMEHIIPRTRPYAKIILKAKQQIANAKGDAKKIEEANKKIAEARESIRVINTSYSPVRAELTAAKETGDFAKVNHAFAEAQLNTQGKIAAKGFFGKTFGRIAEHLGLPKVTTAVKELAVKSPALAKGLRLFKGNAGFAIFESAFQLFKIVPAFQLGIGTGLKQVAKSATKVGLSVGSWAVGAKLGASIGTMICPGPGTIIGGLIGAALVSGITNWAADKLIKDEPELAKEKESDKASANPQELLAAAKKKIETEGVNSADGQAAYAAYQRLAQQQGAPDEQQAQGSQDGQAQVAQANPQGLDLSFINGTQNGIPGVNGAPGMNGAFGTNIDPYYAQYQNFLNGNNPLMA